jgi:nucleoside-diphosphate-sugar epimerase
VPAQLPFDTAWAIRPTRLRALVRAVVTGAAGFIGSQLAEQLLAAGDEVVGIDAFTPYYEPATKAANVAGPRAHERFRLVDGDLNALDLGELFEGADAVFHLAAQPGVRLSWDQFEVYAQHNLVATQRVLEACRAVGVGRLVVASSSSVYGNADTYPVTEDSPCRPYSPYGVTKLAGEQLCEAYVENWKLPVVSLRYFTVYGPRQRPDMSIYRLVESALTGEPFPMYGAGSFVREFTYVADIADATARAASADIPPGAVLNIAGGEPIVMHELVSLVGEIVGAEIVLDEQPARPGDAHRNGGSTDRARELLGWSPSTTLREGIARQADWHRTRR